MLMFWHRSCVCVCKPNASCDECQSKRTKCEYPGKTNVRVGSGTGAGSLTKGRPIVVVPPPKHKSLEVTVWEWANELAEARLEVDRNIVCAMCNLTRAMGHMNVGILSVAGAGAPGVSVGVG